MKTEPLVHHTKYHQLADILRERLRSHPGRGKLPSVRSLMKRFQVSQHTVMSALRLLEDERLISRRQGSGVYASKSSDKVTICFCRPQDVNSEHDRREATLRVACEERGWKLIIDRFNALEANVFTDEIEADAFVLLPELVTFQSPLLKRLMNHGVATLIMGQDTSSAGLDFTTGDDGPVIREFVMGLAKRGHTRIAFLNSEPPFYEVLKRVEYFQDVCQMLELEAALVFDAGSQYGFDSTKNCEVYLQRYLEELGDEPLPFTALITGSMAGSIPAPRVFHDAGFRIPEDLSLACIGSDNRAQYVIPPLANSSSHYTELANAALNIIEKRLSGDKSPLLFETINYRAIWRDSVGDVPVGERRARREMRVARVLE